MNTVAGAAFIIGSAILAGAVDVAMLVVGRVLLGIGVGLCSLVSLATQLLILCFECVCLCLGCISTPVVLYSLRSFSASELC